MPRPRDTGAEERILDAAVHRIERGERSWSLRTLAADAGVSRASLYRRFRSRELLLARLASERGIELPEEAPRDVRAQVLDAVSSLLRAQGLAMTIDEVAQQAGVGAATVYRHFGDREGLLRAFMSERTPRRLAARLSLSDGCDLEGELLSLARAGLTFINEYRAFVLLALAPDPKARALMAELRSMHGTTRAALRRYLARHVRAGRLVGEPARMVPLFVGALLALGMTTPAAEPAQIEANARLAVRAFLHGVMPEETSTSEPGEPHPSAAR
jgi:AcrR family transcriptional regulator